MQAQLQALETQIEQLAERYRQARTQNGALEQELITLRQENRRLNDKVEVTRMRIESLLARLPDSEE